MTSPRIEDMSHFLTQAGYPSQVALLAGDASFRKYWRGTKNGANFVVMDAPPILEDVRPFVAVSSYLRKFGARVPSIIAKDEEQGFLLLEDLGDTIFTQLLKGSTVQEEPLYRTACEALLQLHAASKSTPTQCQSLPLYDMIVYLREVELFSQWFLPQILTNDALNVAQEKWRILWQEVLLQTPLQQNTLVHRDYHADNLLWLEAERGVQRVGMLDYQDALLGDILYDLASLLEDARRDVSPQTVDLCKRLVFDALGQEGADIKTLTLRYDVLAAQRNAKIIGIFMRLSLRDNKPRYLEYLPRVWGHFRRDLTNPSLKNVAAFIQHYVPNNQQAIFEPA